MNWDAISLVLGVTLLILCLFLTWKDKKDTIKENLEVYKKFKEENHE